MLTGRAGLEFSMEPRLVSRSQSSCLNFLSAGITGMTPMPVLVFVLMGHSDICSQSSESPLSLLNKVREAMLVTDLVSRLHYERR